MSEALAPGAEAGVPVGHLAVLLAWTLAGALVLRWRFRWEPVGPAATRN
jgi:hypothetical protein